MRSVGSTGLHLCAELLQLTQDVLHVSGHVAVMDRFIDSGLDGGGAQRLAQANATPAQYFRSVFLVGCTHVALTLERICLGLRTRDQT